MRTDFDLLFDGGYDGQLFEKHQGLIVATLERYMRKYRETLVVLGWYDFEDLYSRAGYYWVRMCNEIRGGKFKQGNTFEQEVVLWCKYCLFDEMRAELRHHNRAQVEPLPPVVPAKPEVDATARFEEIRSSLSADARTCVDAVLGLCDWSGQLLAEVAGKGGHPQNYRSTLRQALASQGWGRNRVAKAFEEIGVVLG